MVIVTKQCIRHPAVSAPGDDDWHGHYDHRDHAGLALGLELGNSAAQSGRCGEHDLTSRAALGADGRDGADR